MTPIKTFFIVAFLAISVRGDVSSTIHSFLAPFTQIFASDDAKTIATALKQDIFAGASDELIAAAKAPKKNLVQEAILVVNAMYSRNGAFQPYSGTVLKCMVEHFNDFKPMMGVTAPEVVFPALLDNAVYHGCISEEAYCKIRDRGFESNIWKTPVCGHRN